MPKPVRKKELDDAKVNKEDDKQTTTAAAPENEETTTAPSSTTQQADVAVSEGDMVTATSQEQTPAGEKNYTTSCDLIRRDINILLTRKEMSLDEFLHAIGDVSKSSYEKFMSKHGVQRGRDNATYWAACAFFEERDKQLKLAKELEKEQDKLLKVNLKNKKRKLQGNGDLLDGEDTQGGGGYGGDDTDGHIQDMIPTTATSSSTAAPINPLSIAQHSTKPIMTTASSSAAAATTSSSSSSGPYKSQRQQEAEGGGWAKSDIDVLIQQVNGMELPEPNKVFDDCDEVRRKVILFLENECGTVTKFALALRTTPNAVNRFLAKKGPEQGAGSDAYKSAYGFFEKLRLLRNQPKSKHRQQSEHDFPDGYPLVNAKKTRESKKKPKLMEEEDEE